MGELIHVALQKKCENRGKTSQKLGVVFVNPNPGSMQQYATKVSFCCWHLVVLSREQKNHCSRSWILLHLAGAHRGGGGGGGLALNHTQTDFYVEFVQILRLQTTVIL